MSWILGEVGDIVVNIETGKRYTVASFYSHNLFFRISEKTGKDSWSTYPINRSQLYDKYVKLEAYRHYQRYRKLLAAENYDLGEEGLNAVALDCIMYLYSKGRRRNVTRRVRDHFVKKFLSCYV